MARVVQRTPSHGYVSCVRAAEAVLLERVSLETRRDVSVELPWMTLRIYYTEYPPSYGVCTR